MASNKILTATRPVHICPTCNEHATSDCIGVYCEYCGHLITERAGRFCRKGGEDCFGCHANIYNRKGN